MVRFHHATVWTTRGSRGPGGRCICRHYPQVSGPVCVAAHMSAFRRVLAVSVATAALMCAAAAPSSAVVGGRDASAGEYPSVAEITFGPFLCTGTLISPTWVLSAGHCSSITGAAVASPASWPAAAINVRIGGGNQDDGGHSRDDRRLGDDQRGRRPARSATGGRGADHDRRLLRRRLRRHRRGDDG